MKASVTSSFPSTHSLPGSLTEPPSHALPPPSLGRHVRAPWIYLGVNVPLVFAVFVLPGYHAYLWGLLGVGSAAAIVAGVIRNRPAHRAGVVLGRAGR